MQSLKPPLTPFVDKLPVPQRLVFTEPGRVVIRLETAQHLFHRDLPPSRVWTYDGIRSRSHDRGRSRAWSSRFAGRTT